MSESTSPTTTVSNPPQTSAQSSESQSSATVGAKASASVVMPSVPTRSQRPQSNAVQGARLKAAIAVPLSFLAFILLLVGVFIFHLRRHRLADEASIENEKELNLARPSSLRSFKSVKSIYDDVEKASVNVQPGRVLASASASALGFPERYVREDMRHDIALSPHQAFLMSPSLRQNPISSSSPHATPTTVPASVFRYLTHSRTAETNNATPSPAAPTYPRASAFNPSPLRRTLLWDEGEDDL